MKILELFSGYGSASFALKRLGISYELVGYSDIDKFANECFKMNHCPDDEHDKLRLGDVTKVNPYELVDFDLLTGGFPCQAFSNAGKMKGELDPRGTLFNEIIRIAEIKQPKYMLLENVKGFTFKKFKDTFDKVLSELDRIGYRVYWKVLNSRDFGVPQNRERVWFVCFRKDVEHSFEFPKEKKLTIFLKDILEDDIEEKYFLSDKAINRLLEKSRNNCTGKEFSQTLMATNYKCNWNTPIIQNVIKSEFVNNRVYGSDGISPCLNVKESKDVKIFTKSGYETNDSRPEIGQAHRIYEGISKTFNVVQGGGHTPLIATYRHTMEGFKGYQNISPAIKSSEGSGNQIIINTKRIRKLTPKECFRLMGFLNDEIKLDGLSDTQRYKLAGNGQDVNVVSLIFKEMFKGVFYWI